MLSKRHPWMWSAVMHQFHENYFVFFSDNASCTSARTCFWYRASNFAKLFQWQTSLQFLEGKLVKNKHQIPDDFLDKLLVLLLKECIANASSCMVAPKEESILGHAKNDENHDGISWRCFNFLNLCLLFHVRLSLIEAIFFIGWTNIAITI